MKRLLLLPLLLLCLSCEDRVMERATITHVACNDEGFNCTTVVKFKDDTIRRRDGNWGKVGTTMWVYKCHDGWCNP